MEIIDDAGSFTRHILGDKFLTQAQVQEVVDVVDDQFRTRKTAADADSRVDADRDQYFFFQGAVMGMLLMAKQVKKHYEDTAWQQGVDAASGEKIKDHGNG